MNRAEGERSRLARGLLGRLGRDVIVPWPVFTEVDLLLRRRGHQQAADVFGQALHDGVHRLVAPTADELALALDLLQRFGDTGVDLPDAAVMAMAAKRKADILTWDFRHFRAVVLRRGHHWPLLVQEHELPEG